MVWVVVVVLVMLVIFQVALLILSHKKRLHLFNYALYLLLDDRMHADQQRKFEDWIRNSGATNPPRLFSMARQVLETHIEKWAKATPSTVAAHGLLWNSDAAKDLHSLGRMRS